MASTQCSVNILNHQARDPSLNKSRVGASESKFYFALNSYRCNVQVPLQLTEPRTELTRPRDGRPRVRLTQPSVEGKINDALTKLLSSELKMPI